MYNLVLARCITPNALLSFIVPCITLWGSNKPISCISVLLWVISAWDVFSVDDPSFLRKHCLPGMGFRGDSSSLSVLTCFTYRFVCMARRDVRAHTHTRSLACDLKNRRLLHLLPIASGVGSCLCCHVCTSSAFRPPLRRNGERMPL